MDLRARRRQRAYGAMMIDGAQQALAHPPDRAGADEQFGRLVHVADLDVIAVGDHIDRNARGIDMQSWARARTASTSRRPRSRASSKASDTSRGDVRDFVEGTSRLDMDHAAVGVERELDHRLASREQVGAIVELDLHDLDRALELRLDVGDDGPVVHGGTPVGTHG